jgi:parallel beta-helix repeat protein
MWLTRQISTSVGIEWGSRRTVGGPAAAGNVIRSNAGDGVYVQSGTGNRILQNCIYGNDGLGIDLGSNEVTPNDPGDGDEGANNLQNFPVVESAIGGGGNLTVGATINTEPIRM